MRFSQQVKRAIVGLTLMVGATSAALAQDLGLYVGGSFGQSSGDIDTGSLSTELSSLGITHGGISTDDSDTGWKVYLGYRFHRNFAVEGGYANLGKFSASTRITTLFGIPIPAQTLSLELEAKDTLHVAALGIIPVANRFSLFGKLGFHSTKATLKLSGGAGSSSESDRNEALLFGLGATYDFNRNLGIRAEWERFTDVGSDETGGEGDLALLSVGIVYRF